MPYKNPPRRKPSDKPIIKRTRKSSKQPIRNNKSYLAAKLGAYEVEKAVFIGPGGFRVIMARRSDVPRAWWYVNWLQQRYQPTGPFMKYEDAWSLATNKLQLDAYSEDRWKLVAFRTPLGTWERVLKKEPVSIKEVMRRIRLKESWDRNRMLRIQRGGKW